MANPSPREVLSLVKLRFKIVAAILNTLRFYIPSMRSAISRYEIENIWCGKKLLLKCKGGTTFTIDDRSVTYRGPKGGLKKFDNYGDPRLVGNSCDTLLMLYPINGNQRYVLKIKDNIILFAPITEKQFTKNLVIDFNYRKLKL